jgi:hypothetical protein
LKKEEIPTLQVILVREGTFKLKSDMTFEELKKNHELYRGKNI